MAKMQLSSKRLQIDKANVRILIVMSVASFVTIFSLVASYSLMKQGGYQKNVIEKKETSLKTLESNLAARDTLVERYKAFTSQAQNAIGGSASGSGERDGDNAKLVLDALPSRYDFPAVATSIERLITAGGLTTLSISGTDAQVEQVAQTGQSAQSSAIVEMPFEFSVSGTTEKVQSFIDLLGYSIRPVQIDSMTLSGENEDLKATFTAKTYYQPRKSFELKSEVVR